MKKHWIVEVWIDEELEGWNADEQRTREEIEDEVSKALKTVYAYVKDVDFVDCEAEEEREDE